MTPPPTSPVDLPGRQPFDVVELVARAALRLPNPRAVLDDPYYALAPVAEVMAESIGGLSVMYVMAFDYDELWYDSAHDPDDGTELREWLWLTFWEAWNECVRVGGRFPLGGPGWATAAQDPSGVDLSETAGLVAAKGFSSFGNTRDVRRRHEGSLVRGLAALYCRVVADVGRPPPVPTTLTYGARVRVTPRRADDLADFLALALHARPGTGVEPQEWWAYSPVWWGHSPVPLALQADTALAQQGHSEEEVRQLRQWGDFYAWASGVLEPIFGVRSRKTIETALLAAGVIPGRPRAGVSKGVDVDKSMLPKQRLITTLERLRDRHGALARDAQKVEGVDTLGYGPYVAGPPEAVTGRPVRSQSGRPPRGR